MSWMKDVPLWDPDRIRAGTFDVYGGGFPHGPSALVRHGSFCGI